MSTLDNMGNIFSIFVKMEQNVLIWVQISPTRPNLKISPSSKEESSPAYKFHFFRSQAKLSSDIPNIFEPKPRQTRILRFSLSQAEPDKLIFLGSSQLGTLCGTARVYICCGYCRPYNAAIKCLDTGKLNLSHKRNYRVCWRKPSNFEVFFI